MVDFQDTMNDNLSDEEDVLQENAGCDIGSQAPQLDELDGKECYKLGLKYYSGDDIEEDKAKAFELFQKSAGLGYAESLDYLGWMNYKGEGTCVNLEDALHCFMHASENGSAYSQCYLGWMYQKGEGVEADAAEAAMWYRKSAGQGNKTAQYNLAVMYDYGQGIPADREEAVQWYQKAADQGDDDAKIRLQELSGEPEKAPGNETNGKSCCVIDSTAFNKYAAREYDKLGTRPLGSTFFSVNDGIPDRKLRNARRTFLNSVGEDELLLFFYDDTLFGSAKDGFAFTDKKLYFRNYTQASKTIALADIHTTSICEKSFKRCVRINDNDEFSVEISGAAELTGKISYFLAKLLSDYINFSSKKICV